MELFFFDNSKSWIEFDDNGLAVVHHMVVADKPLLNQETISHLFYILSYWA